MYLESYIENTGPLPAEVMRFLNTIRALDEKCIGLSGELQSDMQTLLQLPPQYSNPSYKEDYNEVNDRVARMQQMLQQFSDEKVILAQKAHDMIEAQALELEKTMHELGDELKKSHPDFNPADFNAEAYGLESSRYKKFDEWSSLESATFKKSNTSTAPKGKRPKEEETGVVAPNSVSKKKTVLFQQDSLDDVTSLLPGRDEADYPMAFMSPPPFGFKSSSTKPQSNGPFQKESDINASLVGRHAELFWPDDNSWYLIEIQSVDVASRTARVIYYTGETEDLSLAETANDRHMVLVPVA